MATIVTRAVGYVGSATLTAKGSPLTNTEVDTNFINLNNAKLEINGSGANLTALNAGNISTGTLAVARGGTGQTTYLNGELLIGNTTGNTLTKATLTAGTNIAITNGTGTISIATSATPSFTTVTTSGNDTIGGDLAVNGGDITTTATTFNLINATATTLNIGQAATTLSIGATTGTATIRNATVAITAALTVGTTLAVTGNTTLTGDIAVNGGDITTSSVTATVFNTTATTLNIGQAATTISIGATTGTATVRNATLAVSNALTVGTTLAVTGNTTLTGDLAVNGGDITTTSTTGTLFNTNATTLNIGQAATTISIGATTGTTTIRTASTVLPGSMTVSGSVSAGSINTFNITQGTATHATPIGSAPLFSARAWANFSPNVAANKTGTVTRVAGSTTATITITNHGLLVGHMIYAATGVVASAYMVQTVIDANNFTITTAATTVIAAGTAIQLNFATINAQGNINSVAIVQVGVFWVNFSVAMPTTNYAVMGSSITNANLSVNPTPAIATPRTLLSVYVGTATSAAWQNNPETSIVIMC